MNVCWGFQYLKLRSSLQTLRGCICKNSHNKKTGRMGQKVPRNPHPSKRLSGNIGVLFTTSVTVVFQASYTSIAKSMELEREDETFWEAMSGIRVGSSWAPSTFTSNLMMMMIRLWKLIIFVLFLILLAWCCFGKGVYYLTSKALK